MGIILKIVYVIAGVVVAGLLVFFLGRKELLRNGFLGSGVKEILRPISNSNGSKAGKKDEKKVQDPLNGVLYTEADSKPFINVRPLAVMINNYIDARPQSGLINADLVYEVIAEGGITRFLAFFLSKTPEKIGPIRSAREYYLVLVKELGDAVFMHIGWSPQALEAIETWPVRSLGRGGGQFWRDTSLNVATEHTAYSNGTVLRKISDNLGWSGKKDFDVWQFKNDKEGYNTAQAVNNISIDFWNKGDYSAIWKYDQKTNGYLRFTGYDSSLVPIPHKDRESGKQIWAKNVIVQFAVETKVNGDEKGRLIYDLIGSGDGLVFIDGKVNKVTWSKALRDGRTKFYNGSGEEFKFNRGMVWISIVPDRNVDQVVYK